VLELELKVEKWKNLKLELNSKSELEEELKLEKESELQKLKKFDLKEVKDDLSKSKKFEMSEMSVKRSEPILGAPLTKTVMDRSVEKVVVGVQPPDFVFRPLHIFSLLELSFFLLPTY